MLGWFRRPLPAVPPLTDYVVRVHVRLTEPLTVGDSVAFGYHQVLGLRVTADAQRGMTEGCVTDGSIVWTDTETKLADVSKLDRDLTKLLRQPFGAGVWFRSGRILYTDSDEDDDTPDPSDGAG